MVVFATISVAIEQGGSVAISVFATLPTSRDTEIADRQLTNRSSSGENQVMEFSYFTSLSYGMPSSDQHRIQELLGLWLAGSPLSLGHEIYRDLRPKLLSRFPEANAESLHVAALAIDRVHSTARPDPMQFLKVRADTEEPRKCIAETEK